MRSPFERLRDLLADRLRGPLDVSLDWPLRCPIGWQPSVFTPVFYGIREHTIGFPRVPPVFENSSAVIDIGAEELPTQTVRCLIFYPTLDGSPIDAPILRGCGRYPLVIFAHGHCGEEDHFRKWYELPATLARCGNVVIVPDLPMTNSGTPPSQNDREVAVLINLIRWARTDWEDHDLIMADPATGLVGHSFGAALTGRVVVEGLSPVRAHASLSGTYPAALKPLGIPKLLTWGTGGEDLLVPVEDWDTKLAAPAHVIEFHGAGHWDYLPEGRSSCVGERGDCTLVPALAADVVALFFGRYMPPEKWADGSPLPSWLPWFRVSPSLRPPPLLLTREQHFFGGGHLAAWPLLANRSECGVTLNWRTLRSSGSVTLD